jgi:carbonic anhydrase/acetyltransferase-like protein (isoleucine patch superfamily)
MALYEIDGKSPRLGSGVWVADSADVVGDVEIGDNASVWFGVVIRGDNETIRIGKGSNVQDLSVLHSDQGKPLSIGNNVTLGHQVMVHGCTIGDNVPTTPSSLAARPRWCVRSMTQPPRGLQPALRTTSPTAAASPVG